MMNKTQGEGGLKIKFAPDQCGTKKTTFIHIKKVSIIHSDLYLQKAIQYMHCIKY